MGNFSYIVRRGRLSTADLIQATCEVNEDLFGGIFDVEGDDDSVRIGLDGDFWWGWDRESGGKFGGKYPRQGSVGNWVHLRFMENVADRLKARLAYEFIQQTSEPEPQIYPTFVSFQQRFWKDEDGETILRMMRRLLARLEQQGFPAKLKPYLNGPDSPEALADRARRTGSRTEAEPDPVWLAERRTAAQAAWATWRSTTSSEDQAKLEALAGVIRLSQLRADPEGTKLPPGFVWKAGVPTDLRGPTRYLLEALAREGIVPGKKLDVRKANRVIDGALRLDGATTDRWGNYHPLGDPERRVKIKAKTLREEVHRAGGWVPVGDPMSLIDYATARLQILAGRLLQVEAATAAAGTAKAKRQGQKKAAVRRAKKKYLEAATQVLIREALATLRDQKLLVPLSEKRKSFRDPDVVAAVAGFNDPARREQVALDLETRSDPIPNDGAFWSLGRPPYPWLGGQVYRFEEAGYTVTFQWSPDATIFQIGASSSGLMIDPLGNRVKMNLDPAVDLDRHGDGMAIGEIRVPPCPKGSRYADKSSGPDLCKPIVLLTHIFTDEKGKGAGRKLMSLVARLVRGYGREAFVVQNLTREGRSFFEHLRLQGALQHDPAIVDVIPKTLGDDLRGMRMEGWKLGFSL